MIHLHDLMHRAVTAVGTRPRPDPANPGHMIPVPVRIALYHPDADQPFAVIGAESFALHSAKGQAPAELLLSCVVPPVVFLEQFPVAAAGYSEPPEEADPLPVKVAGRREPPIPNSQDASP